MDWFVGNEIENYFLLFIILYQRDCPHSYQSKNPEKIERGKQKRKKIMRVLRLLSTRWKKSHKLLLLLLIPVLYYQWTTVVLLRNVLSSNAIVGDKIQESKGHSAEPENTKDDSKKDFQQYIADYIRAQRLTPYDPSVQTNYTGVKNSVHNKWGQTSKLVAKYFKFQEYGFFVEYGGVNTYLLEKLFKWTGLVIETDPALLELLKQRNRRAWVTDVCLSKELITSKDDGEGNGLGPKNTQNNPKAIGQFGPVVGINPQDECFSLSVLMAAVNRTNIDYFSLDVKGKELDILKIILFDRIPIKLISVGVGSGGKQTVKDFLESIGYVRIKEVIELENGINDDLYEFKTVQGSFLNQ